jgi:hypothetical protein
MKNCGKKCKPKRTSLCKKTKNSKSTSTKPKKYLSPNPVNINPLKPTHFSQKTRRPDQTQTQPQTPTLLQLQSHLQLQRCLPQHERRSIQRRPLRQSQQKHVITPFRNRRDWHRHQTQLKVQWPQTLRQEKRQNRRCLTLLKPHATPGVQVCLFTQIRLKDPRHSHANQER